MDDLPHNMCQYHANFIEAVGALHKAVPSVPGYHDGFVQKFLCEGASMDCRLSKCNDCNGISVTKLNDSIDDSPLNSNVEWMVWKKKVQSKRIEK